MAHYRDAPFSRLVGMYILADTLLVHGLKDPIITLTIDVYCWSVPTELAKDISSAKGTQPKGTGADEAEVSSAGSKIDDSQTFTTPFWSLEPIPGLEDPCKGINMAWEALPRDSRLCRLTVECFCDNVIRVERQTNGRQYHPAFLAAIAHNYALRLRRVDWNYQASDWDQKGQICKFHEHSAASDCPFARRDVLARNPHKRTKRARNEQ